MDFVWRLFDYAVSGGDVTGFRSGLQSGGGQWETLAPTNTQLKKAVEKGFANVEELKNNPDLETVRGERAYKQLIETLSRKSANTTGGHDAGSN